MRVAGLLDPPRALFAPGTLARVLRSKPAHGPVVADPWHGLLVGRAARHGALQRVRRS